MRLNAERLDDTERQAARLTLTPDQNWLDLLASDDRCKR